MTSLVLQVENEKLKRENSQLRSRVSELEARVSDLEEKLDGAYESVSQLLEERDDVRGEAPPQARLSPTPSDAEWSEHSGALAGHDYISSWTGDISIETSHEDVITLRNRSSLESINLDGCTVTRSSDGTTHLNQVLTSEVLIPANGEFQFHANNPHASPSTNSFDLKTAPFPNGEMSETELTTRNGDKVARFILIARLHN